MNFASALLYSLLMNGLPLIEVVASGRSPAILLLLYWFETVLLLVTGVVRIVLHRRATRRAGHYVSIAAAQDANAGAAETRRALGSENAYLKSFLSITVIFTLVHGLFVLLLVFLFRIAGPVSGADVRLALTYAVCVQALFLAWDVPRIPRWTFAELSRNVGTVSLRVLVTQLGLIFGFVAMGIFDSPWGLVGTFIVMRALADASLAWLVGLMKQRDLPPGLARVLTRTAKQSAVSLEAEFDAVKARGSEVEAFLELPIEEARKG